MSERRTVSFRVLVVLAVFVAAGLAAKAQAQNAPASPPLTLRRALEMALARSPDVAVARADAEIAGASERIAWSRWGPEAYAATNPGYTTGLPVMVAGQVPSLFSFAVRQSIYDPALRAGSLGARAEAEERRSAYEHVS
ncbi:MAG TPA: TolC family protein, partial [Thermoanaerobaculia bacterium]|nr:TolC family protein [Thermoanaerobaculia bacterium]